MNDTLTFKPRPSKGWLWLLGLGLLILASAAGAALPFWGQSLPWVTILIIVINILFASYFLVLTLWFPTMRYELDNEALTLRYGPVLRYRIPLKEINGLRRRNLGWSIWSSFRLPGLALFTVNYSDIGNVKMCATAALTQILLIETDKGLYGLTPADEEAFVAAVKERLEI
jgi:hypothetical protein